MKKLRSYFLEDRYVLTLIALNALVLFLLSFPSLDSFSFYLELIDLGFLSYFGIEAAVKIRQYGWKSYISSGWNRFDFALVILSVPTVLVLIRGDWSDLSLFFVLRVARVARFFKFLRFVPNIQELIAGIKRAFKASLFVLLAFTVYCFVVALVSCRLYHEISPEMFGDPLASFYHIFQVFTIEGWNDIPKTMISSGNVSEMEAYGIQLYFMIVVATGGLFGLSIVNAIFVEEMVRDNNDELELQIHRINSKIDEILLNTRKESGGNTSDSLTVADE